MHYPDALAVFSALGRLVDHDETGAVIRVGDNERLLTPAQVMSSAAVLLHSDPDLHQGLMASQDRSSQPDEPVIHISHEIGRAPEQAALDNLTIEQMTGPVSVTVSGEGYVPDDDRDTCACGEPFSVMDGLCPRCIDAEAVEQERLDTIRAAVEAVEREEGLDSVFAASESGDDTPVGVPVGVDTSAGITGDQNLLTPDNSDGELDTHATILAEALLSSLASRPCSDCGALNCDGSCKCDVCGTMLLFGECPGCNPPRECRNCGAYFTPDESTEDLCHYCIGSSIIDYANTASGDDEPIQNQETSPGGGQMSQRRHICTSGRNQWAAEDGFCSACRPPESDQNAISIYGVMDEFGGPEAVEASIREIIDARVRGLPGTAVANRLTRPLLERVQGDASLLAEYREYLAQFSITLEEAVDLDDQGTPHTRYFHNYTAHRRAVRPVEGVQPVIPGLVNVMNHVADLDPNLVRTYRWQAAAAERREARRARVEAVRSTRHIQMCWVSNTDPSDRGSTIIGPNTEETRDQAAEWQAAGRSKGYKVTFNLLA